MALNGVPTRDSSTLLDLENVSLRTTDLPNGAPLKESSTLSLLKNVNSSAKLCWSTAARIQATSAVSTRLITKALLALNRGYQSRIHQARHRCHNHHHHHQDSDSAMRRLGSATR